MGWRKPSRAAFGSVVGSPAASVAHVSGIGSPFLAATRILARAATLMAMSSMTGSPPGAGTPSPSGLLPRRASRPPHGAMVVVALLAMIAAKPSPHALNRYGMIGPKWLLPRA